MARLTNSNLRKIFTKQCKNRDESKELVATPNQLLNSIKYGREEPFESPYGKSRDRASCPSNVESTTSQTITNNRDWPVLNHIHKPSSSTTDECRADTKPHRPAAHGSKEKCTGSHWISNINQRAIGSKANIHFRSAAEVSPEIHCNGKAGCSIEVNQAICSIISAMDEEKEDDESHLPVAPFDDSILPGASTTSVSSKEILVSRLPNKHSSHRFGRGVGHYLLAEDSDCATAHGDKIDRRTPVKQRQIMFPPLKRFFRKSGVLLVRATPLDQSRGLERVGSTPAESLR